MKTIKTLLVILASIGILKSKAQNMPAQTMDHATVAGLKVMYKAVPQTTTTIGLMAIPQASVSLKNTSGITKIYLKIIDKTTNTIIYNVNYSLSSGTVNDNNGKKLFENNNGTVFLSNGQALALKPYVYEVQTEDTQSHLSTIFSAIQ